MLYAQLHLTLPAWVHEEVDAQRRYPDADSRIALAIQLSRRNVDHRSGGPFGAAVAFEQPGVDVADPADLPLLCALIVGAILAFLWFNVHPAQIFMGDSGALALGATLAVTALITGQILLLPLIGLVFVLETGSVILQVLSVRLRGRRLFLMSPLHHHFELRGWDEEKITLRFWIVGALAALVGVAFFLGSRGMLG